MTASAPGRSPARARGPAVWLALAVTSVLGVATAGPVRAAVTTVTDSFSRTVTGGWGTADTGGGWSGNNTVVDNGGRPLWVVQDSRVASNRSTAGHDPRRPFPDPTVTWLLGPVILGNNVIGGRTTATCLLCAQDTALRRTPAQIGLTVDGNVWFRPSATAPGRLATWPTGTGSTQTFLTLAALTAGTGQETRGNEITGAAVDAGYRLTAEATAATGAVARPLPGWISALAGASGLDPWLGARFG
jgi:hypothetical protein